MVLIDKANYDGPLGKKQHVFPAERYFQEPESFLTEAERRCDAEEHARRMLEEWM